MNHKKEKRIAILASGNGSNAQRIAEYFKGNTSVKIQTIITNKQDAFVIERAKQLNIPCRYFSNQDFNEGTKILDYLLAEKIDIIVLAGFLRLIPFPILKHFGNKAIINIHPALLPKYGGKGMYGMNVHKGVIENQEKESGITIHYVSDKYDEGEIILQQICLIDPKDTLETLAEKVHALEYEFYPKVIEQILAKN